MPKFNANIDFIPVSADFIENHMPAANGAYVKVYLLSLSLGINNKEITTAEMAGKLNLLESDVVNALEYWNGQGVLKYTKENVLFGEAAPVKKTQTKKSAENTITPRKKSMREIAEEMTENKALADLCTLAQEILEKPLKNKDIETLYWIHEELGLSAEVITLLLEYCVSIDKRSINYAEKVAITWHENGIVTMEAADKFISAEADKRGYMGVLKKHMGINDRNFSKTEETYLRVWHDDYGMDENMVGLAYEYCVDSIHKLSFPYMDGIIKRWKELGISTIEAAEQDHNDFKNKNKNKTADVFDSGDTDYDEIEKIIRDKM